MPSLCSKRIPEAVSLAGSPAKSGRLLRSKDSPETGLNDHLTDLANVFDPQPRQFGDDVFQVVGRRGPLAVVGQPQNPHLVARGGLGAIHVRLWSSLVNTASATASDSRDPEAIRDRVRSSTAIAMWLFFGRSVASNFAADAGSAFTSVNTLICGSGRSGGGGTSRILSISASFSCASREPTRSVRYS